MAPHEWKWINWLLRFSAFSTHTYTHIHTHNLYVHISVYYVYAIYIVGFNLRRFTCKLMGRPNLRTCPIIGVLFESLTPAPSSLRCGASGRKKKNNIKKPKAKWKLLNIYTKRAYRDLWQAFMATQIFVKCQHKYLFNQSTISTYLLNIIRECA